MGSLSNVLVVTVLLFMALHTASKKTSNTQFKCDVCKAIISEVEHEISQVDPNKMIQVGSFRVDPNGKTRTVQKKYARSETHVSDLLDNICEKISSDYVERKDQDGNKRLSRLVGHDGKMSDEVDLNQLIKDSKDGDGDGAVPPDEKSKAAKFACNKMVEDHEDDLMELFQRQNTDDEDDDDENKAKSPLDVCHNLTDYCKLEIKKLKAEAKKKKNEEL